MSVASQRGQRTQIPTSLLSVLNGALAFVDRPDQTRPPSRRSTHPRVARALQRNILRLDEVFQAVFLDHFRSGCPLLSGHQLNEAAKDVRKGAFSCGLINFAASSAVRYGFTSARNAGRPSFSNMRARQAAGCVYRKPHSSLMT